MDAGIRQAIERRPFVLQTQERGRWGAVPGAWYATREEAEAARRRLAPIWRVPVRIVDARK